MDEQNNPLPPEIETEEEKRKRETEGETPAA